jgi:hypothetical protein
VLVLVVMALATTGVVYAHWTETLTVDAQIATGTMGWRITSAATDDDHANNSWEIVRETAAQEGTEYDRWPGTSSNDPGSFSAGSRYTKDVARCRVTAISTDKHTVMALVENAYPSYHCTIYSAQSVTGTVPFRNQSARVSVCMPPADCSDPANYVPVPYDRAENSFSYDSGDGDPDFELVMQVGPAGHCGSQHDPGTTNSWRVGLHILQDAEQNATYYVRMSREEVNWNEWSVSSCDGYATYVDPSGSAPKPVP